MLKNTSTYKLVLLIITLSCTFRKKWMSLFLYGLFIFGASFSCCCFVSTIQPYFFSTLDVLLANYKNSNYAGICIPTSIIISVVSIMMMVGNMIARWICKMGAKIQRARAKVWGLELNQISGDFKSTRVICFLTACFLYNINSYVIIFFK